MQKYYSINRVVFAVVVLFFFSILCPFIGMYAYQNIGAKFVCLACNARDVERIKDLLNQGADVNAIVSLSDDDNDFAFPFYMAG
mgnify:CR=1 FL=1